MTFFRWETVSEALPDNRSASASPAVPCPASLRPSCAERGILPFRRRDGRRDDVAAFSCRRQRGKRFSRHALRPTLREAKQQRDTRPDPSARPHAPLLRVPADDVPAHQRASWGRALPNKRDKMSHRACARMIGRTKPAAAAASTIKTTRPQHEQAAKHPLLAPASDNGYCGDGENRERPAGAACHSRAADLADSVIGKPRKFSDFQKREWTCPMKYPGFHDASADLDVVFR